MPVANYKVFQWGNPVGRGVMGSRYVAVSGVAKAATDAMPMAVVNELICADLARAVKLPVPPSFLVHNGDGTPYHVSLNFYLAGEDLPPADAGAVVADLPAFAAGIVLFDAWVCNEDRHPSNLAYDRPSRRVTLFDHSHSFLTGDWPQRLERVKSELAIGNHCIARELTRVDGFSAWHKRIMAVPEFYIKEAVAQAVGIGPMDAHVAAFAAGYLLDRRDRLLDLVDAHRAVFPKINEAQWAALKGD